VAWLDTETGETAEQRLVHSDGEAERFYRGLAEPALIGLEATGNCHWLQDLLCDLGHEGSQHPVEPYRQLARRCYFGHVLRPRVAAVLILTSKLGIAAHCRLRRFHQQHAQKAIALLAGRTQPLMHPRANLHQLVAMNEQLPQIALPAFRHPQVRKPSLHQLQNVCRIPLVRLLSPYVAGTDPESVAIESSPRVPLVGAS